MRLILRFLRTYAAPYWPWYLLGLVALYGTNKLTVLLPRYFKEAIDALTLGDLATSRTRVYTIAGMALAMIVIRTTSRLCFFNPGRAAEFCLKNHLFRHLISLPQSFHDSSRVGDLMSRATNDLQSVRALIGFAGLQMLEAFMVVPMVQREMQRLDGRITTVTFALLLIALAALWASAQTVVRVMRRSLEQLAELSDHILDTYSAIPVVQGFCARPAFDARFSALNEQYVRNSLKISQIRAFLLPVVSLSGSLCVGVVLWWGGQLVLTSKLSVGALVAYSGYIGILVGKMMSFGWMLSVVQRGMVSLRRVYALLDTRPELPEVRAALPAPMPARRVALLADRSAGAPSEGLHRSGGRPEDETPEVDAPEGYGIEVRHLTFTYPGSEDRPPSLQDVTFRLEPGQTLGVFGHTGSGKSSLVHLLARVYTPPPGTVFLNGVDLRDVPLEGLRNLIALVPQDPFLFSTSIRNNILWGGNEAQWEPIAKSGPGEALRAMMGRKSAAEPLKASTGPDGPEEIARAGLIEAQVARAVDLACLSGDLQAISQGLETMVGARGITLSGGQRQRVALARAFYRPFRILLLDDVLAAVDHSTERKLIQNIYSVAGTEAGQAQTTVIISHRVSALLHADQILVLEHGRVIDRGTHAELASRGGVYAETWRSQQEAVMQEVSNG